MDTSPNYPPNYKPTFKGHKQFPLRYGWLKKIYDALVDDIANEDTRSTFHPDNAMGRFGVGSHMVSSMEHWARCCGMIETPKGSKSLQLTDTAHFLFNRKSGRSKGRDPFLEHPASLWLLHWLLAAQPKTTTWHWSFNHFRRAAFTRKEILGDLVKMAKGQRWPDAEYTIKSDVGCFLLMYAAKQSSSEQKPEEAIRSPFHELGLIRMTGRQDGFRFVRGQKSTLGQGVFMYALINFWRQYAEFSKTLSFEAIVRAPGSPGNVFLLEEEDVKARLRDIEEYTEGSFRWSERKDDRQVHRSAKLDLGNALEFVERDYPSRSPSTNRTFDIDKAMSETLRRLPELDFESLEQYAKLPPVLAKRHYHATGALRWLDMCVVFTDGLIERVARFNPDGDALGQVLLVIPTVDENDTQVLEICKQAAASSKEGRVAIGLSSQAWRIIDAARELNAIEKIREDSPEIAKSAVTKGKFEAREGVLRGKLEKALRTAIDDANWCFGSDAPMRLGFFGLSERVSDLADELYDKSPHIHIELLNCINPTSQAKLGRDDLIRAMISHVGKARLGLRKYRPELGMFCSLLEKTELYQRVGSSWDICNPNSTRDSEKDSARLSSLWNETEEYLKQAKHDLVSVSKIYEIWSGRPFGVKRGVMPVLLIAYILSMRDNLEIFRNRASQTDLADVCQDFINSDGGDFQLRWVESYTKL